MADLFTLADQLDRAIRACEYHGYGPRPIPHELDRRVDDLVTAARAEGPPAAEVVKLMDRIAGSVLKAYAERMATLAVRRNSTDLLERSVLALGLADVGDSRDTLLVMPLPWRSAELLEVDQRDLFERVAALLPEPNRSELLRFAARDPKDQTLACMGYREGRDQDGFRYERTW